MVNTFYELEMEANRMGYSIVPRYKKLPKLHTCICGGTRVRYEAHYNKEVIISCPDCRLSCKYVKPDEEHIFQEECIRNACKMWNEMIVNKSKAKKSRG